MAEWKKWASIISVVASSLFSFLIVFQIPLFRVACRNKRCETPLEVISSELIANELVPSYVVKTFLFPGAFAKSLLAAGSSNYHNLFTSYGFDHIYPSSFSTDIHHLEVFAGSCLCLLGALLNIFKPTRISFLGTLLIYWGLVRDMLLLDSAHYWITSQRNSVRVYPMLFLASLSAFLSMRSDLRKIIRCCRSMPSLSTKGD
ncbi:PREDICTED: uncharacterized protein LOC104752509 [Camelina sativa]|uniref:Uncharacterized protein LOC104752509 n=1 Tax=Camelina sativa TaxID=90675 RepID=A0ABM0WLW9_CAMSA|nr:PREDICTED: uncharacterized protein LOC104752509 [Camelina sativa]